MVLRVFRAAGATAIAGTIALAHACTTFSGEPDRSDAGAEAGTSDGAAGRDAPPDPRCTRVGTAVFSGTTTPSGWSGPTENDGTLSTIAEEGGALRASVKLGGSAYTWIRRPMESTDVIHLVYSVRIASPPAGPVYFEPGCGVVLDDGAEDTELRLERKSNGLFIGTTGNDDPPLPFTAADNRFFRVDARFQSDLGTTAAVVTIDGTALPPGRWPSPSGSFTPRSFEVRCGIPYSEGASYVADVANVVIELCSR